MSQKAESLIDLFANYSKLGRSRFKYGSLRGRYKAQSYTVGFSVSPDAPPEGTIYHHIVTIKHRRRRILQIDRHQKIDRGQKDGGPFTYTTDLYDRDYSDQIDTYISQLELALVKRRDKRRVYKIEDKFKYEF